MVHLSTVQGEDPLIEWYADTDQRTQAETLFASVPALSPELYRGLSATLHANSQSPASVVGVLHEAMRRVATDRLDVGRDVLLVQTTPFASPWPESFGEMTRTRRSGDAAPIEIDFASPIDPDLLNAGPAGEVPVRYTPWLLSPWECRAPMVATSGECGVVGTPWRYLVGSRATEGLPFVMAFLPQPRPHRPRIDSSGEGPTVHKGPWDRT